MAVAAEAGSFTSALLRELQNRFERVTENSPGQFAIARVSGLGGDISQGLLRLWRAIDFVARTNGFLASAEQRQSNVFRFADGERVYSVTVAPRKDYFLVLVEW